VAKILGWAGDETPWQLGAVFTTPRTLERRERVVEAFLRAYRRGAAVYDDVLRAGRATPVDAAAAKDRPAPSAAAPSPAAQSPAQSAAAQSAARALAEELRRFIPSSIEEILDGAPVIDREGRLVTADVREQVAWFQARGLVDRGVEADDLFAPQILELEAARR
jgi:NitT/TauT family transport system substrate-binding protein